MPTHKLPWTFSTPAGAVLATPSASVIVTAFLPDGTVEAAAVAAQPSSFCTSGMALAMVVTDGGSTTTSARARVIGTDVLGRALDERVSTNAPGSNSYPMTKPFYTIDEVEIQGVGFAGADRIALVLTGVLGLPVIIGAEGDIHDAAVDSVVEPSPVISVDDNTWTPGSAPNGVRTFSVYILE